MCPVTNKILMLSNTIGWLLDYIHKHILIIKTIGVPEYLTNAFMTYLKVNQF